MDLVITRVVVHIEDDSPAQPGTLAALLRQGLQNGGEPPTVIIEPEPTPARRKLLPPAQRRRKRGLCPYCRNEIALSAMSRHQKSKRCHRNRKLYHQGAV